MITPPDRKSDKGEKAIGKLLGVGSLDTDYKDLHFRCYYPAIGGSPCGVIVDHANVKSFTYQQRLDPFAAKINKVLIDTNFQLWSAATFFGADAFCPNRFLYNAGSEVNMYVGVSPDGILSDSDIQLHTQKLGGPWKANDALMTNAYTIDITKLVTQPKDPSYSGIIYVTFWWADTAFWWRNPNSFSDYQLRFKQLDVEDQL
jgi:hypothetical protein